MSETERRLSLDDNYLKKNDEKQDEQLKELNGTLLQISGDIREIMTKMNHFEERFESYTEEIDDIRKKAKENEESTNKVAAEQEVIVNREAYIEKEIERLNEKQERDISKLDKKIEGEIDDLITQSDRTEEKADKQRRWLINTVVSGVIGFVTITLTLLGLIL